MNKYEILNRISEGARGNLILSIEYREKDGSNEGFRLVEPYSMRDTGTDKEAFFAYDLNKEGIRRFSINRILSVEITNNKFVPRNGWIVEF